MIELEPIIAAVITALATLGSVLGGQMLMRKKAKNCVIRENAQNANVYTALKYVLQQMEGDRVYIMEFHNGESYFSGRSQQKYSCTHEVVEEGISAECEFSQNHRVSNYHDYINRLVKDSKFAYKNIEDIDDRAFHQMLVKKGVKSIYNVPIKTLNGKIIGILGIDYVKNQIDVKCLTDDNCNFMHRQARLIAGYLI